MKQQDKQYDEIFCRHCGSALPPKGERKPYPGFPGSDDFIWYCKLEQDPEAQKKVSELQTRFFSLVKEFEDNRLVPYFIGCLYYLFSSPSRYFHYIDDIRLNDGTHLRFLNLGVEPDDEDSSED